MQRLNSLGRERIWALFILSIILIMGSGYYLSRGLSASDDTLVMPLDDTYIHFQYARQMATGDPYVYNPGQDPTSGATSFIYSPLLAIGYFIGFQGLSLSYWAIALGIAATAITSVLIFELIYSQQADISAPIFLNFSWSWWIGMALAGSFILGGPFLWATMSGMETSLFMLMSIASLYAMQTENYRASLVMMFLVSITRPEGAVIGGGLALFWIYKRYRANENWFVPIGVVIAGVLTQPLVNLLVTGDFSATGNQAKSHLYNVTIPMNERIDLILDNVLRIWEEFLTGSSPIDGIYLFPIIAWLALGWMLWQTWQAIQSRELKSGPIILLWLIGMSILIATLDTAFWHFKRYQLPMMVLFFPLAGWTLTTYLNQKRPYFQYVIPLVLIANGVIALSTFNEYARRYEDNVAVVQNQQIRLAEYINNNVESDAVIAVHDVGILRYIGQRTTYDVVGLTTEGTASAWRQGPGTLYELLKNQQPDYFAIYPDIQGLPLLVEAGVYGETEFAATYDLPENTAASATSTQLLTVPDWQELTTNLNALHQPISNQYADNFDLVGVLNVADLKSEADYDYEWTNTEPISGFATAVRRLDYHVCSREDCELVDGTRILNGGESFDLPEVDEDFSQYLVILRVHAATPARLNVGCGGDALQTLVVPQIAGEWVEIPVLVSAEDDRFCVDVEGTYEPALYWIFAGNYAPRITAIGEEAKFQLPNDDGAVTLKQHMVTQTPDEITIDAIWSGSEALSFDGKVFIHLYEDASQPPVRQVDRWVAGALPPSNWLVGDLPQTYRISTTDLPSGIYRMAIGFYNPVTGERYQVNGAERYFIESIVID